jgi:hypothetical protein
MNQNVCLLRVKFNDLLNQLIMILNGLYHKVHDDVTTLVLPAILVIDVFFEVSRNQKDFFLIWLWVF